MATEAGEYIVGAYLQHICDCGVILYNTRLPGGKLTGLNELDVLGLNLPNKAAYLCEVTTHLHGMRPQAASKAEAKLIYQRLYAEKALQGFRVRHMLWSPLVAPGLVKKLKQTEFELVINADFTRAVEQLEVIAKETKHDTGNPFMRTLQILAHLKPT